MVVVFVQFSMVRLPDVWSQTKALKRACVLANEPESVRFLMVAPPVVRQSGAERPEMVKPPPSKVPEKPFSPVHVWPLMFTSAVSLALALVVPLLTVAAKATRSDADEMAYSSAQAALPAQPVSKRNDVRIYFKVFFILVIYYLTMYNVLFNHFVIPPPLPRERGWG